MIRRPAPRFGPRSWSARLLQLLVVLLVLVAPSLGPVRPTVQSASPAPEWVLTGMRWDFRSYGVVGEDPQYGTLPQSFHWSGATVPEGVNRATATGGGDYCIMRDPTNWTQDAYDCAAGRIPSYRTDLTLDVDTTITFKFPNRIPLGGSLVFPASMVGNAAISGADPWDYTSTASLSFTCGDCRVPSAAGFGDTPLTGNAKSGSVSLALPAQSVTVPASDPADPRASPWLLIAVEVGVKVQSAHGSDLGWTNVGNRMYLGWSDPSVATRISLSYQRSDTVPWAYPFRIQGQTRLADGSPFGPIDIQACRVPDELSATPAVYTRTTDSVGRFSFTGLLTGTYEIEPQGGGYYWNPYEQFAYVPPSLYSSVDFTGTITRPPLGPPDNPPKGPFGPVPADGATNQSTRSVFRWSSSDPDPCDTLTYDIYVDTRPQPEIMRAAHLLKPEFEMVHPLQANTTYYWQVSVTDNHGAAVSSPVWHFTTGTSDEIPTVTPVPATVTPVPATATPTPLPCLVLASGSPPICPVQNRPPNTPHDPQPVDGGAVMTQAVLANIVTLSWTGGDPDPGDAVLYKVAIYTDTTRSPVQEVPGLLDSTLTLRLSPEATYYWRVTASDSHGASTAGPIWRFKTGPRLILYGIEVTQGIQSWAHSVRLFAKRPTFVRVHLASRDGDVALASERAELFATDSAGNPLSPPSTVMRLPNGRSSATIKTRLVREALYNHLFFPFPDEWLKQIGIGTLNLEVRLNKGSDGVDHPLACPDQGAAENCKTRVYFEAPPPARVKLYPIFSRDPHEGVNTPDENAIQQAVQSLESILPVEQLDVTVTPRKTDGGGAYVLPLADGGFHGWNSLLFDLNTARMLDKCPSSGCPIYGALINAPSGATYEDAAKSGTPTTAGAGKPDGRFASYLGLLREAHEFGHAAGRDHTFSCGGGDEVDADKRFPYPDGRISRDVDPAGEATLYGLQRGSDGFFFVKGPKSADIMTYCSDRWISDRTYERIADGLIDRFNPNKLRIASVQDLILVSGWVTPSQGTADFLPFYTVQSGNASTVVTGTYQVRFENAQGQAVATYGVALDGSSTAVVQPFAALLPWDPTVTRVVLLSNGRAMASRQAAAHQPSVSILWPRGGETLTGTVASISWSGSHPDGLPLSYVVQYSRDAGTTWDTLATNWISTTFGLDLGKIAGTTQGLIRVLGSDGFSTVQAQSPAVFSVAKHAPVAWITDPPKSNVYVGQQLVLLAGRASDLEDGDLSNAALTWTSSLSGTLGTGRSLSVNAQTLAEGSHTITLTARDSDGQTSTAQTTIRVSRTPVAIPAQLAVAPGSLVVRAAQGFGEQSAATLLVENAGDGTLSWAASADKPWLKLAASSGSASADLGVSVDPTGLALGQYTGQITVTASGGVSGTQVIPVTLDLTVPYRTNLPLTLAVYDGGQQSQVAAGRVSGAPAVPRKPPELPQPPVAVPPQPAPSVTRRWVGRRRQRL